MGLQSIEADDQDSLQIGSIRAHDEAIQRALDLHQDSCHEKSLRKVHQLHSGLHFHLQTDGTSTKLLRNHPRSSQRRQK